MIPNKFHYAFDSDADYDANSDADTDSLHKKFWSFSTGVYSKGPFSHINRHDRDCH